MSYAMKPIGLHSKDFGCCPGHDKVPYKTNDETNRGRRTRKIKRKKRLTRYWKRSFKNTIKQLIRQEYGKTTDTP